MQHVVRIDVTNSLCAGSVKNRGPAPVPCPRSLRLLVRCRHHEPVKVFGDFDLTRQPRTRANIIPEIEHVLFHWRWTADLLAPGFIDIDMASGASAGPSALGLNARDVVADRGFHDRRAQFGFDSAARPARVVKGDLWHLEG